MKKTYYKKSIDLEEKVKHLKGYVVVVHPINESTYNVTFSIGTSKALHSHIS